MTLRPALEPLRIAFALALFAAMGCGRSIRQAGDDASGDSGGASVGGTAGRGGASGSSGAPQGGSAQGGSSQGGFGAIAGAAGENTEPATLLLQTGGVLWATDLEGTKTVELCADETGTFRYGLVDWVDERAIVFRDHLDSVSDGELLRVALDGSECTSFFKGTIESPLPPVVGGRVVFTVPPAPLSQYDPDEPIAIVLPATGLSSVDLDGTSLATFDPSNVTGVWITDDRVLFVLAGSRAELYTALPDATQVEELFPTLERKSIMLTSGSRVFVSVGNDVYAVDADGSRPTPLVTSPETERPVAMVGDQVIIERTSGASARSETDLFRIGTEGGALVPLTTSAGYELFLGASSDRLFYEHGAGGLPGDIFSLSFQGGDPARLTATPDVYDDFGGVLGDRVVYASVFPSASSSRTVMESIRLDGLERVALHGDATQILTLVADRVVFYVGHPNYDLASVPTAGGDVTVLADSEREDLLVGRLGRRLIVHRGHIDGEDEVRRVDADGSNAMLLAESARYLGAVSETCGAVLASDIVFTGCP